MAVTGDISTIYVGAHTATFGGSAYNLGFTQDGSEITYTPEYVDIMADQVGKTLLDKRMVGEDIKVKLILKEVDTQNLLRAFPGAIASGGGAASGATGMDVGRIAGYSTAQNASGALVLHPVGAASGDLTRDWTIPMAVVSNPVTIPSKVDAETVLELEFQAIADTTADDGKMLMRYGY